MTDLAAQNTDRDMLKLEQAFFANLQRGNCEYGGIGLDDKRPFGNSDVDADICELLGQSRQGDDGWSTDQRAYAGSLYSALIGWLQRKYLPRPPGCPTRNCHGCGNKSDPMTWLAGTERTSLHREHQNRSHFRQSARVPECQSACTVATLQLAASRAAAQNAQTPRSYLSALG